MATMMSLLGGICGLGGLICFILVIVKMFQNGAVGLAIASLVLLLCGIGYLVAFIIGWTKATEWNIKNVMLAWTGLFLGGVVFGVLQLMMSN